MSRSIKDYALISAKGLAMGAADVVPGVSGGTIAFITGIYEELLSSINSLKPSLLTTFKESGFKGVWQAVNGNFLAALFIGIGISIASLAKGVTYLLTAHPVMLWAFFFGLIIGSILLMAKAIKEWNIGAIIGIFAGTAIAYITTIIPPSESSDQLWYIYVSGTIAICAMILPGISGSFILVLLGAYSTVMSALKEINIAIIATFMAGCVTGLLTTSRILGWLLKKKESIAIATLTGFLIGSLNKVWPWKQNILTRTNRHDEVVAFIDANVLPGDFHIISAADAELGIEIKDPQMLPAIGLAIVGFLIIFFLDRFANKKSSMKLGLVGFPLSHSFSRQYFNDKFSDENQSDFSYENFEIPSTEGIKSLFDEHDLDGINVTIPHKKSIIEQLDGLSPEAETIGAVNTVKRTKEGLIGYNTDIIGFRNSLEPLITTQTKALVLGTGGASSAVAYVLKSLNISFRFVSRSGELNYDNITAEQVAQHQIIINTTPLGTAPNTSDKPDLPYEGLTSNHILHDLIYNPPITAFMKEGIERDCITKNGHEMLIGQAEASFKIWTSH